VFYFFYDAAFFGILWDVGGKERRQD